VKRVLHLTLTVLWSLILAVAVATYLFNTPSVLEHLPKSFWHTLVLTLDAKNAEEIADVEILVVLVISVLFSVVMTYFSVQAWRMTRGRQG